MHSHSVNTTTSIFAISNQEMRWCHPEGPSCKFVLFPLQLICVAPSSYHPSPHIPADNCSGVPGTEQSKPAIVVVALSFVPKHPVSICQRDRAGDGSCFPAFWSGRLTPCNPRSCLVYDRFTSLYRPCFFGVMSILFCASKCFSVSIQNFVPFSKFVDI
jgi:hypothetical protein